MATQAQYHAAIVAMSKLAHAKIAALPFFEQGMAAKAMSPDLIEEFAKVAVDAAIAMPIVPGQNVNTLAVQAGVSHVPQLCGATK